MINNIAKNNNKIKGQTQNLYNSKADIIINEDSHISSEDENIVNNIELQKIIKAKLYYIYNNRRRTL